MKPIIKWAGGKSLLLNKIRSEIPYDFADLHYVEPFVGGGAVFIGLKPKNPTLCDINGKLISLYCSIKYACDELLEKLNEYQAYVDTHDEKDISALFYQIRNEFNKATRYSIKQTNPELAAEFILLNKLGYNGLYRENSRGEYNTPFGHKPQGTTLYSENEIIELCDYLNTNNVVFKCQNYVNTLISVIESDEKTFVYLDPPYDDTFTNYSKTGFNRKDQIELSRLCVELDQAGHKFMLSNSNTELINSLYGKFHIEVVNVNHSLRRQSDVEEVLIRNY